MNGTTRCILGGFAVAPLPVPPASLEAANPPGLAGSFPLGVYRPCERTAGLAKRSGLGHPVN